MVARELDHNRMPQSTSLPMGRPVMKHQPQLNDIDKQLYSNFSTNQTVILYLQYKNVFSVIDAHVDTCFKAAKRRGNTA